LGVEPGDRVAGLETTTWAPPTLVGCAVAGAVRVPLCLQLREAHQHMIDHTQCKVVVADSSRGLGEGSGERDTGSPPCVVRDSGYEAWLAKHDDTDRTWP
jgi:acyl-CoA synthetase (AMP-forming)/AMP-acid ligase II